MKIVFIANSRIPTEKAHGYQIAKICEELSGVGVGVALWVPTRKNTIQKDPFDFYSIRRVFTVRTLAVPDLISGLHSLGPISFYLQGFIYFIRLVFTRPEKGAWIMTRNAEIAWLFHLKGYRTAYYAHFWPEGKNGLLRFFLRGVDAVIANSQGTKDAFTRNGFSTVTVVPNGVDVTDFSFTESKDELRKELALPQEKKIALYAGHLYPWKGIDILFEAAELLKNSPDILLVLVGGTPADYEQRSREIEENGLANILLTGYQEKKLIPKYLCSADVLLLPNAPISTESMRYTSPIKMFEYLAAGVPIVASDLPSTREVLNHTNAVLVEAGSAQAVVEGITRVLSDSQLATRISERARKDAELCTWRSRAQDIVAFLTKET